MSTMWLEWWKLFFGSGVEEVHQNAHHWIFDDLAIDEYRRLESNILNVRRKIVCKEPNAIGMVIFQWKVIVFWTRSRKGTPVKGDSLAWNLFTDWPLVSTFYTQDSGYTVLSLVLPLIEA